LEHDFRAARHATGRARLQICTPLSSQLVRLRGNARGRNGGVREESATRVTEKGLVTEELMLKSPRIQLIDRNQIEELASRATASPRKRAHLLLHDGPADPVQRLLIVLQPNSYVRPHHHSRQWEMLALQQGRGSLLIFDSSARLADRIELSPSAPIVQISVGIWHGFVVLERNTAVLEIKPGPYRANEFAHWAPEEGDADADRFVEWATNAALGSRLEDS
jgi:cupin fold WbuC family metalloprotein